MGKGSETLKPKFSKRNLTVVAKHPNDGQYYRGKHVFFKVYNYAPT